MISTPPHPGQDLFTVDQVADRLQLHPKTVRQYIRDGRLTATRIGKSYRIAARDLAALAGEAAAVGEPEVLGTREVQVATTVDIHAVDPDTVHRLTTLLTANLNGPQDPGRAARLDLMHDARRGRLRIVIAGGPKVTADLLRLIQAVTEP
ncbi:helix-turn-helix domain-containing protein [Phenylobacterium sp.]|uniref:helix-turn-helix domain-containing protein n=1 Tax=Phenylobacterium sp. TaxID=1871053 RepID=UPI00271E3491|nr:helix-turn-helix domain-containing protein [Phenylobacterium sp.]MDO8378649.1 helix-turn-helix domain-containing protein [Phenylobacterium sp.]